MSPGIRYELHLFWDQRRFRVRKRKIKLNSPQLLPHWVFFSKTESTLLLFSCLNNLLPGTPVRDAVMHCGRQCGLCHLLEWKTALRITDHQQFSLVLGNRAGITIFKKQISWAVEGWKPCRQDYSWFSVLACNYQIILLYYICCVKLHYGSDCCIRHYRNVWALDFSHAISSCLQNFLQFCIFINCLSCHGLKFWSVSLISSLDTNIMIFPTRHK